MKRLVTASLVLMMTLFFASQLLAAGTAPSMPSSITISSITTTGFTLSWPASTGTATITYHLTVNSTNYTTTSTSQAVSGLSPATAYGIQLYATNSYGTSATQNGYTYSTYAVAPVATAATAYTTPASNGGNGYGFTANWNASTGATGYALDVANNSSFTSPTTTYPTGTSATVTGLSAGTSYYYRVRAIDGQGTNPTNSNVITALTVPAPPVLNGRSATSGTTTTTSFTVTWAASTSATGYYLDVATDSLCANTLTGYTNLSVGNVTSYNVTGVSEGTNYYYCVQAYNGSGNGMLSSGIMVDTVPVLTSLTAGISSSDPNPVVINTGVSAYGGPYVRSTTPYLTATFNDQVTGVQYSVANEGIVLKNSAGTIQALATPYNPVNNTTPTTGSPGSPSTATFQPASALATTSCATSKYSVTLTGGTSSTTIHDTETGNGPMTSVGPYYFTVDTTSPTISSVTPANNATSVSITQAITVVFTENCSMNPLTFTPANIQLTNNATGIQVPVTIAVSATPYTTVTITPSSLEYNTTYTLTLNNIADAAGNLLSSSSGTPGYYTSVFTTAIESASSFSIIPSFLSSPVAPNVLIILDNSNSFDETLTTGDAIGSFNCTNPNDSTTCSRSVLARQALIQLINSFANKINIGLMSFAVPDNTSRSWYVYDNFYFVSYDPRTYCGIIPPPTACYNYCVNENPQTGVAGVDYTPSTNEADCDSACRTGQTISSPVTTYTGIFNSNFQANIRDAIVNGTTDSNGSAIGDTKRQTYCANVYPKTVAYGYTDPARDVGTLYHSVVGTFYDTSSGDGTGFVDALTGYNTSESHTSSCTYYEYRDKATPTTPPYDIGYSNLFGSGSFAGTDDDLANGFLNYGQSQMWYPPYNGNAAPTWSAYPYNYDIIGGFLHVPVAANNSANNTQLNALLNMLGPNGFANNATGYMACTSSGDAVNRCPYIVNAGGTPTASTLQDAINYFNGTLAANKTQANAVPATPITSSCQKNFVILVTDGLPSIDGNAQAQNATTLVNGNGNPASVAGGTVLSKLYGLRCLPSPSDPINYPTANCLVSNTISGATVQSDVQTYVLGLALTPLAGTLLDQMAVAGGTATSAGHAYYATDPVSLNNALVSIFQNILSQLSAGTAASILNNNQGSGANMLQAVFYPTKTFDSNTQCGWIGEMQNLWYYVDPTLKNSAVFEDTLHTYELNLKNDNIATFYYNSSQNQTLVNLYTDSTGTGIPDSSTPVATVSPDYVKSLWKAGMLLWNRNLTTDPRTLYTGYKSTSGSTPSLLLNNPPNTTPSLNSSLFSTSDDLYMLQIPSSLTFSAGSTKALTLLNWVSGADQPQDADGTQYRSRSVTIGSCSNDPSLRCAAASNCIINGVSGTCNENTYTWKLGDIVSSTPKIESNLKLNSYDSAAPSGYGDTSYAAFANTSTYQNRGMIFVGSNDGMLHAFKLGLLQELTGRYDKASVTGTNLGHEEWAFVPTNALPYLTYLTNPTYQHIYLVDKTPAIADVSIGIPAAVNGVPPACSTDYTSCPKDATTWRTILIGGMGLGGAAKMVTDACVPPACVKPPIQNAANSGLSSYFALDITNPETPLYLWEFNGDPTNGNYLGYSTTGPAIIHIAYKNSNGTVDQTKNGKWFAVFASGPTGPINTTLNQFQGQSDQNLKLFIVDLATGTLVKTIDTGITNAFAGSISTSWIDVDRNNPTANGYYSDDAIYVGYTQLDTTAGTWTKGGIIRVLTQESSNPASAVPSQQWLVSTLVSGVGPVTTSIAKLQDTANGNLWIYFGTGRYFYKGDDPSTVRQLYGVKDPCYSSLTNRFNLTCTTQVTSSTTTNCATVLGNQTGICDQSGTASTGPSATLDNTMSGWLVNLDGASGTTNAERVITDPSALTNGNVFFTTFEPNSAVCAFGGTLNVWALNYSTGGVPASGTMQGTALVQSSTGAFSQIALSTAFTNTGNARLNGRRSASPIQGVPAASQGLSVVTNPKPVKKIVHIREK